MTSFTERIKQKALEIGFQKIEIMRAEELEEESERLRTWLGKNRHGEMQWMEREPEKRSDPRLIFPAARSVIVVAINYFTRTNTRPT